MRFLLRTLFIAALSFDGRCACLAHQPFPCLSAEQGEEAMCGAPASLQPCVKDIVSDQAYSVLSSEHSVSGDWANLWVQAMRMAVSQSHPPCSNSVDAAMIKAQHVIETVRESRTILTFLDSIALALGLDFYAVRDAWVREGCTSEQAQCRANSHRVIADMVRQARRFFPRFSLGLSKNYEEDNTLIFAERDKEFYVGFVYGHKELQFDTMAIYCVTGGLWGAHDDPALGVDCQTFYVRSLRPLNCDACGVCYSAEAWHHVQFVPLGPTEALKPCLVRYREMWEYGWDICDDAAESLYIGQLLENVGGMSMWSANAFPYAFWCTQEECSTQHWQGRRTCKLEDAFLDFSSDADRVDFCRQSYPGIVDLLPNVTQDGSDTQFDFWLWLKQIYSTELDGRPKGLLWIGELVRGFVISLARWHNIQKCWIDDRKSVCGESGFVKNPDQMRDLIIKKSLQYIDNVCASVFPVNVVLCEQIRLFEHLGYLGDIRKSLEDLAKKDVEHLTLVHYHVLRKVLMCKCDAESTQEGYCSLDRNFGVMHECRVHRLDSDVQCLSEAAGLTLDVVDGPCASEDEEGSQSRCIKLCTRIQEPDSQSSSLEYSFESDSDAGEYSGRISRSDVPSSSFPPGGHMETVEARNRQLDEAVKNDRLRAPMVPVWGMWDIICETIPAGDQMLAMSALESWDFLWSDQVDAASQAMLGGVVLWFKEPDKAWGIVCGVEPLGALYVLSQKFSHDTAQSTDFEKMFLPSTRMSGGWGVLKDGSAVKFIAPRYSEQLQLLRPYHVRIGYSAPLGTI